MSNSESSHVDPPVLQSIIMSQSTDISYLRQLVQIITENVDAIERLAYEQGVTHPTIDDLCEPTDARETFTLQPDVIRASTLATSAASQLVATLKLPNLVLRDRANAVRPVIFV